MSYPQDDSSGRILAVLIVYLQATILRQSLGGGSGGPAVDAACNTNKSPDCNNPLDTSKDNHEPPHLAYSEEDEDGDDDNNRATAAAASHVAATLDEAEPQQRILEILQSLHISPAELGTLVSTTERADDDDDGDADKNLLRAQLLAELQASEPLWRFLQLQAGAVNPDSGNGGPTTGGDSAVRFSPPEQCGSDSLLNDMDEVPNLSFTPMKPPQSPRREEVVAGADSAASLLSLPGDNVDDGTNYVYDSPSPRHRQQQQQQQQQQCDPLSSDVQDTNVSGSSTGMSGGPCSLRALVASPGDWDMDVVFGSPARAPPPDAMGSGTGSSCAGENRHPGDKDHGRSGATPPPSRRFDFWQNADTINTMMVNRIDDVGDCDSDDSDNNRRLRLLEFQTDVEVADDERRNRERQHAHMAQQILEMTGQLLHHVDRGLNELDDSMLGSALVRGCHELADTIGGLAEELERHPERRALAEACLQDFDNSSSSSALRLTPSDDSREDWEPLWHSPTNQQEQQQQLVGPSHDDVLAAVTAAAELLRDVEAALRAVERDEADEIAAVALTVAHLFVSSLVHVHAQLRTPEQPARQRRDGTTTTPRSNFSIERLDDDDDDEDGGTTQGTAGRGPTSTAKVTDRVRCLWPPVGLAVGKALNWSKEELEKRHWILTAALGITLWPWAVAATCLGTPAVLADHALQHVYNQFQQGPVISAAEVGAAQLYQTGRLLLLTGRSLARPTWRVARRQVQRHGPGLRDWAVHRVTHPVATVGETVSGLAWLSGQVVGTVQRTVQEWQQRHDEQRVVQGMAL